MLRIERKAHSLLEKSVNKLIDAFYVHISIPIEETLDEQHYLFIADNHSIIGHSPSRRLIKPHVNAFSMNLGHIIAEQGQPDCITPTCASNDTRESASFVKQKVCTAEFLFKSRVTLILCILKPQPIFCDLSCFSLIVPMINAVAVLLCEIQIIWCASETSCGRTKVICTSQPHQLLR